MRWVEITVQASPESCDAASNIMTEEGCGGTAISRSSDSSLREQFLVKGYLPVDDRLEGRLDSIKNRIRQLPKFGLKLATDEISIKWVEEEEWASAWKKFFKPLRVGRVVIKPTWEEYHAEPEDIIVEIDPGMAFGTGNHPTTQLCLLALQDYIKGGETVLDMGTGSAILAIAAAKLGANKVVGIDLDPVAVEAAIKNVQNEKLENKIIIELAEKPTPSDESVDLIVANIIANVIIELASDFRRCLKPGGKLITSGIIRDRADEVRAKLESFGLITLEEQTDGEWVAIISQKE